MKFERDKLSFLKMYASCSDTKTPTGDKIFIISEADSISFMQFSYDASLFYQIPAPGEPEYKLVYNTDIFTSFVSRAPETFELKEDGIYFNGAKYHLDLCDYREVPDMSVYAEIIGQPAEETFTLKDLNKAYAARQFCGADALSTVALQSNNYVASDMVLAYMAKTVNRLKAEKDEDGIERTKIYLPRVMLEAFEKEDFDSVDIKSYPSKGYWYYNLNGLNCAIPIHDHYESTFPNLIDGAESLAYGHKNYVKVSSKELSSIVSRMMILTKNNPYNRIFLSVEKDGLVIENRDRHISSEKMSIKEITSDKLITNKENIHAQIVINCGFLSRIISALKGDDLFIYISDDENSFDSVRFEDEHHEVQMVHVLYSAI